jgi:addiction module HigA family antidote
MFRNRMRPVHPGEILREDYLVPLGLSATALAKALNVPSQRVNEIVRERRGVTADTAMRLARYFGGDARSWLNLQSAYDLRVAEIRNAKRIKREIAPAAAKDSDEREIDAAPNLATCERCDTTIRS